MEKKDFDIKLGSVLKKHREKQGLYQSDVAKKLGVTSMAVSYWETGQRSMYAFQLRDYCHLLGLTTDEVFEEMK